MIYVLLYLTAILAANLDIVYAQQVFGYTNTVRTVVTVTNAFLFIGFDLTARDGLHDAWRGSRLALRMALLIAAGSALSWVLNREAGQIALASFVAFAAAGAVDAAMYHILLNRHWPRRSRMTGSNIVSAAVDSLLFPTIAFGGLSWTITGGQFVAKVMGGWLWARLLTRGDT